MTKATIYYTSGEQKAVTPANGSTFSLEELQAIVEGYIELAPMSNKNLCMVVNEEGVLQGLDYNFAASLVAQYPIVGNALVCPSDMIE